MPKISSLHKGLIFWAPLTDEHLQSATLASEKSAYQNHADTALGAPTFDSNGMQMDGTDDAMRFTIGAEANCTSITIACRFTPDFQPSTELLRRGFFRMGDTTTDGDYECRILETSGNMRLRLGDTQIFDNPVANFDSIWNKDQENTLIITGTSGDNDIYLNGTRIGGDSDAWSPNSPTSITIGNCVGNTGYWDGHIRDFCMWNRILSDAERAQYENGEII